MQSIPLDINSLPLSDDNISDGIAASGGAAPAGPDSFTRTASVIEKDAKPVGSGEGIALTRSGSPAATARHSAIPEAITVTDGCSGKISWLWRKIKGKGPAFEYCCDEHDLFYDQGGGWRDRLFADRLLRDCMLANLRRRGRPPHPAWVFYVAVRGCGWLYWETFD